MKELKNKPILFFDDTCVLCNGTVRFILKHEKNEQLYFAGLSTDLAKDSLPKNALPPLNDSLVVWNNGKVLTKSSAALFVTKFLKWYFAWMSIFKIIPLFIANPIYDLIAKNRYKMFGQVNECLLTTPENRKRFLAI